MTEKSLTEACRTAEAISMFCGGQRRDCFGYTESLAMTPEQLQISGLKGLCFWCDSHSCSLMSDSRHSGGSRNPEHRRDWAPAFAGVTTIMHKDANHNGFLGLNT